MSAILASKRILIIDDFAQMRSTLKHMLMSLQVSQNNIDVAANAREALRRLDEKRFDIVLCDYNLGEGQDGQQLLEEAKHRRMLDASTLFVMITAENTVDMVMGAIEYRPDDYLAKPFNKGLLRSRLEGLVDKQDEFAGINEAIERQDRASAVKICDALIASKPKNLTEVLRIKAELSLEMDDLETAQQVYDQVLALRNIPWAMLGMGRIAFAKKDYANARAQFEALISEHANYMEGHDWLARTLEQLGETKEAQQVLSNAVKRSPKALKRQEALGHIAHRNNDHATAQQAFKKTVDLGRHSVHKSPEHYAGLAQAMSQNGQSEAALKVLGQVQKEFKGDKQARLQATLGESEILSELGQTQGAATALAEAEALFKEVGGENSARTTLAMAQAQLRNGNVEKARELMQDVVRNNHENKGILDAVQHIFDGAGLKEEGSRLISDTADEVLSLNNTGVGLAKEGKLNEALALFDDALKAMPNNATVNLNAAQVRLMHLQRNGEDPDQLRRVRINLEQVARSQPENPTLHKLQSLYRRLAGKGVAP